MTIQTLNKANEILDDEALTRQVMHEIVDVVADDAKLTPWLILNGRYYLAPDSPPLLTVGEGT